MSDLLEGFILLIPFVYLLFFVVAWLWSRRQPV